MKPRIVNQKLILNKETINNLNGNSMEDLKGGIVGPTTFDVRCPTCKYPTNRLLDCPETTPATYTCGEFTCHCMSINPV